MTHHLIFGCIFLTLAVGSTWMMVDGYRKLWNKSLGFGDNFPVLVLMGISWVLAVVPAYMAGHALSQV